MDDLDRAHESEEHFRITSIKNVTRRPSEEPDEDEHGRYCLGCGHTIPEARLNAQPLAVRCIHCQTKRERK